MFLTRVINPYPEVLFEAKSMKTLLLVYDRKGREALMNELYRCELSPGQHLIELEEMYKPDTAVLQRPACKYAEEVARSDPLVKKDGTTEIKTMYVVRDTHAIEETISLETGKLESRVWMKMGSLKSCAEA